MAKPEANSPLFTSNPPAKEKTPPSQTSFHPFKTSNSDPPKNREDLHVGSLVMESLIPFAAFDALETMEGRAEARREHCDRQRIHLYSTSKASEDPEVLKGNKTLLGGSENPPAPKSWANPNFFEDYLFDKTPLKSFHVCNSDDPPLFVYSVPDHLLLMDIDLKQIPCLVVSRGDFAPSVDVVFKSHTSSKGWKSWCQHLEKSYLHVQAPEHADGVDEEVDNDTLKEGVDYVVGEGNYDSYELEAFIAFFLSRHLFEGYPNKKILDRHFPLAIKLAKGGLPQCLAIGTLQELCPAPKPLDFVKALLPLQGGKPRIWRWNKVVLSSSYSLGKVLDDLEDFLPRPYFGLKGAMPNLLQSLKTTTKAAEAKESPSLDEATFMAGAYPGVIWLCFQDDFKVQAYNP
uniref:Uncharacterized protein n=1 Tax=Fagus sylvatica TaxID=28930 RepID=A0A2N9J539_FAGSY